MFVLPLVKKRIDELKAMTVTETVMSITERKEKLTKIARANLTDFVTPSGEPDISDKKANVEALAEFTHTTRISKQGDPVIEKSIKLINPITAIAELNKMDKVYSDAPVVNNNTQVIFVIGKGYVREQIEGADGNTSQPGS
jgi:hypothetical protein